MCENYNFLRKFDVSLALYIMPLLDTIHYPDGTALHLWWQTETVEELVESCRRLELPVPAGTKCCERRLGERLAEVLLVHRIFGKGVSLGHTPGGAPTVAVAGCHISISHTREWVGIARNDNHRIGIDIERCDGRVLRVRERFLSAEEQAAIPCDDIIGNTLAWTAKEALYKLFSGNGGASLSGRYSVGECVQVINCGYLMRPATAACLPGEPLTVVSQVMSGAVVSLAVETRNMGNKNDII